MTDGHALALIRFTVHGDGCAKRFDKWDDCTCGLRYLLLTLCRRLGEPAIRAAMTTHWTTDFAEFEDEWRLTLADEWRARAAAQE